MDPAIWDPAIWDPAIWTQPCRRDPVSVRGESRESRAAFSVGRLNTPRPGTRGLSAREEGASIRDDET
jgi:hypothetical protein